MDTIEIWRDVQDFEGLYQISNLGNVKSLNYKRQGRAHNLKKNLSRHGYHTVLLHDASRKLRKNLKVHRLVAIAFIPNPDHYPEINHINEDKLDNRVENLEWCTKVYNLAYGSHDEKVRQSVCVKASKKVRCVETGRIFESIHAASAWAGVKGAGSISCACNHVHNTHTSGGYHWEFAEESTDAKNNQN
jgi:hypothetical protein